MSQLVLEAVGEPRVQAPDQTRREMTATAETLLGQVVVFPITDPWAGRIVELAIKRTMDIVGSLFGLVLFSPIFLITAVVIKLESPGPLLFKQKRIGKAGAEFDFLKFRSMVNGAEKLKDQLLGMNEKDGPIFKIKNDPRVTRVGRFIRKYSIDELPQFFNVLRGEMSLVGPRPPLPREVKEYGPREWRRLSVTPGLTCTWQVSGRSNLSFEEWVAMDMCYIRDWNILFDIGLLLRTPFAVLRGDGAC